jgi:hypothetical protein
MKYTNEHPDKNFAIDRPQSTVELAARNQHWHFLTNYSRGFTTEQLEKANYKGIYECF